MKGSNLRSRQTYSLAPLTVPVCKTAGQRGFKLSADPGGCPFRATSGPLARAVLLSAPQRVELVGNVAAAPLNRAGVVTGVTLVRAWPSRWAASRTPALSATQVAHVARSACGVTPSRPAAVAAGSPDGAAEGVAVVRLAGSAGEEQGVLSSVDLAVQVLGQGNTQEVRQRDGARLMGLGRSEGVPTRGLSKPRCGRGRSGHR